MTMNILATINDNYGHYLGVCARSLAQTNPKVRFDIYVLFRYLSDSTRDELKYATREYDVNWHFIEVDRRLFHGAPVIKRYPYEIYYRIFAHLYLPKSVERVLYLDPDTISLRSLEDFYNSDFGNNLFIGASHVKKFLNIYNCIRLAVITKTRYLNTGVLMMNIKKMRECVKQEDVYRFIRRKKIFMNLPDQDILWGLYHDRIKLVDTKIYNINDRMITQLNLHEHNQKYDLKWVDENVKIIHYIGLNKPWKKDYHGILKKYYDACDYEYPPLSEKL